MPHTPTSPTRRDSWPPTQVRLAPTIPKEYPSLDDIDEDPLTYFLTPAPDLEDADDVDMMDFDAGIEDNNPREIVRSVSPSSLDSLNKSKRCMSPPVPDLSDLATPEGEDEEDYIRFAPQDFAIPFSLRDFTIDGIKSKPRLKTHSDALLSPSPPARDRVSIRPGGRGRQHSVSFRHRQQQQHLWREPSPDVWSIEEETEEELLSEMGSSVGAASDVDGEDINMDKDVEAAKPKKKVRFLLPAEE
ncbi:uncharacterized protein CTRU02_211942 [Colletotrichum truncatum]|uniref:Uncharacterized protein n=1 Tax=Colletotrichum truncatum TaxID=5467 RepID=A0ACC3YM49_COLTU|nr:uncharacterized protein CTRU02_07352 [Colletotrichum truncatum]KAF6791590.1 hypothetical protein CTRU02_07352 [Colletotrichum truncatum]